MEINHFVNLLICVCVLLYKNFEQNTDVEDIKKKICNIIMAIRSRFV